LITHCDRIKNIVIKIKIDAFGSAINSVCAKKQPQKKKTIKKNGSILFFQKNKEKVLLPTRSAMVL
jgi:hypothetical protein